MSGDKTDAGTRGGEGKRRHRGRDVGGLDLGESSLVGEAGGDDTDCHGGEDFGLDHVDDMTGVAKGLVSPHIISAEPAAQ